MKKKIIFFLIIFSFVSAEITLCKDVYNTIEPEKFSEIKPNTKLRYGKFKKFVVVTANDYASEIGYEILKEGGSAADAAIAIQLTLGLVEPQSSGLGGGLFITYFDNKTKIVSSFEGREEAPKSLKDEVFLDENGDPKKFFDAVIGGASVGVPATLRTLYEIHKDHGELEWKQVIKPVIDLSNNGFFPPNRLINALKKEKFLFKIYPNSIFRKILESPEKIFFNDQYTETLEKISKNFLNFYTDDIAKNIVAEVKNSKNSGQLSLRDLQEYKIVKNNALCHKLESGYKICGPNLPSSGTICTIQGLILFESLYRNLNNSGEGIIYINDLLNILNFIYNKRDHELADPNFVNINQEELFNKNRLVNEFKEFEKFNKNQLNSEIYNLQQIFNSTSHFSIIDEKKNVLSATSSIENSFGSRLFTNGFFLNNQLTDFTFEKIDKFGKLKNNRPEGGKRPLSSMAPLIIFDQNNKFVLTVGSPGGKAIISYVIKSLVNILFEKKSIKFAIESPNYIRIRNKTYIEDEKLNDYLDVKGLKRSLTSGISIIKNVNDNYIAGTDFRRDGTVRGK